MEGCSEISNFEGGISWSLDGGGSGDARDRSAPGINMLSSHLIFFLGVRTAGSPTNTYHHYINNILHSSITTISGEPNTTV